MRVEYRQLASGRTVVGRTRDDGLQREARRRRAMLRRQRRCRQPHRHLKQRQPMDAEGGLAIGHEAAGELVSRLARGADDEDLA